MSIKNHLSFLELLYKKKEKISIDFLNDEIDVDSYFFHNFLDVFIVQNRTIRLSKDLFRENNSIKEFILIHILRIKVLNLRLNYTSQGTKFCLFSKN